MIKVAGLGLSLFLVTLVAQAESSCPYVRADGPDLEVGYINTGQLGGLDLLNLRYGIQNPRNEGGSPARIVGDVLFIHGFADRMDNHEPLFSELNRAGLRVITFDLPGHGENSGITNDINKHTFKNIVRYAAQVIERTKPEFVEEERPLLLAGWSTGGLLAIRIAQGILPSFPKKVSGLILYAPGVSVRLNPGEKGVVTHKSLTSNPNPPHCGPISPLSPVKVGLFPPRLLKEGFIAKNAAELPKSLPVMMFVGGRDSDVYAKSNGLVAWGKTQRAQNPLFSVIQCEGGKHELDNDDDPKRGLSIGHEVRRSSAAFASAVVQGNVQALEIASGLSQCSEIR